MNIQEIISIKVTKALENIGAPINSKALVRKSLKGKFGHYQINGIMSIAKQMGIAPRQLATQVLINLNIDSIASNIEIAGPGFINISLDYQWVAKQIKFALADDHLGITRITPQTIIVDYSSPNIAKEMHVGHLRSTIIGDASVRTLEFLGHNVIRANHVGDWGTQFGMLIAYIKNMQSQDINDMDLAYLESCYRAAKKKYDHDVKFAESARSYVVKLQKGEKYCRKIWHKLVDITMSQNQINYNRLNVTLTKNDIMGESLYNNMLPEIVDDLKKKGLAINKEGAVVVFLDEYKNKKGNAMGVIIQKKDGGYLYVTSDIACAKYRYETLNADRVLYYIDSRQQQHLIQAWTIVRKAGYVPESVSFEHHMFGMMLDKDGKPFKTRSGSNIKLSDLLDEAIKRAGQLISTKNPKVSGKELSQIIEIVGIGAIKYADLSKNRTTNYIFNWDNILTFEGNTAPYIQYAYTRISSIFKRVNFYNNWLNSNIILTEDHEKYLAVCLIQFEETIIQVAREGAAHVMCTYLYNLAALFSIFYEQCPILTAKNKEQYDSRLQLASLTAKTLKIGLNTLGIETVERM
ncbi:Arginine--tRNA ligase [Candidatus Profftia lariciata]|uniref:arginine--tRNA ligase n=1 Tax=Candidatus Profftia lariciata TaxID=1987921 RepID=UPI001D01879C|nr:arginine--tRNA ligase [Candidatus Profftia lariciata]UDG81671.1 Arginine--tRNA ligase [Candidatus Profftia lariciata]